MQALADTAAPLTEYAWKFRYPGDIDEPDRAEAEEALQAARSVYNTILGRLTPGARP